MAYNETGEKARAFRGEVYRTILRQIGPGKFRVSGKVGKISRISHYSVGSQARMLHVMVQDGLALGHIEKVGPSTYQRTEKGEKYETGI